MRSDRPRLDLKRFGPPLLSLAAGQIFNFN